MSAPKKIGLAIAALLLIGGVVFALGPKVTVDEARMQPVEAPPTAAAALDGWLADREARFDDITPDTARRITWVDPATPARTPLSIVYLHGFGATRQETAPVAEQVARAVGANLFETRLRGHGRPGETLAAATAEQWMEDTIEAIAIGERIGGRVVVIGCSTGATLAVWAGHRLAAGPVGPAQRPPVGMALLSPNLAVADPRAGLATMPWGAQIVALVAGDTWSWEPANPDQGRFWTTRHPSRALVTLQALVEHVQALPAAGPPIPTLAIWSIHDAVVDIGAIERWVAAAPELRRGLPLTDDVHRGNHVIAGAIMAPSRVPVVAGAITDFVRGLPGP